MDFPSRVSRCLFAVLAASPPVFAGLPGGVNVTHGYLKLFEQPNALQIQQQTPQAIANWQSFSVGKGQRVDILQPSAQAALLNRVVSAQPSEILGQISANGRVYLVNPNGILVGPDASVNAASFIASTLDLADEDFLNNGDLLFQGDSLSPVVNVGSIKAENGDIVLLGVTVSNEGELRAPQGVAALGAGNRIVLSPNGDQRILVGTDLSSTTLDSGVENRGLIEAAQAELKAAGGNLYALAVNQNGIIDASGIEEKDGRILLTADDGNVLLDGNLSASNDDGSGGEILVGGDYQGKNPAIANARNTVVTADAVIDVSAKDAQADAGKAIVWADENTRFEGTILGRGGVDKGDGGFAEVSGKKHLAFNGSADLRANQGENGQLLLDPEALIVQSGGVDTNLTSAAGDPFTFTQTLDAASILLVSTLEAQLALSNVTLDTSVVDNTNGSITVNNAVNWNSASTLHFRSGNDISINADLNGQNGAIVFGLGAIEFGVTTGRLSVAGAATLSSPSITIGKNSASVVVGSNAPGAGPIGDIDIDGRVDTDTLTLDVPPLPLMFGSGGIQGNVTIDNPLNRIGTVNSLSSNETIHGDLTIVNGSGDLLVSGDFDSITGTTTFRSANNLTLSPGTVISSGLGSDIVLAAENGSFSNNAGANALDPGLFGMGRFLVYSDTPDNTTMGGLTAAPVYNKTYAGNSPGGITQTGNRFLYSLAPTLTFTADDKSREYGEANPAFSYSVSGLINGDLAADAFSGSPTLSSLLNANSPVGTHNNAITVTQGAVVLSDYDYQFAGTPGDLTITPAMLNITPDAASRLYGDPDPMFSATITGFKNGETAAVLTTQPSFTNNALSDSDVGNYDITASGAAADNYTISYTAGTDKLSINPAPLTVRANDVTRQYGSNNPAFSATFIGLRNDDTAADFPNLGFSTPDSNINSDVGNGYRITPVVATNSNYTYTFEDGSLNIVPAFLFITANSLGAKFGEPLPAPSSYSATFSGLLAGDQPSDYTAQLQFHTDAVNGSPPGNYDITPSGVVDPNYNVVFAKGTLTIGNQVLTVKADDITRLYGQVNPEFTASISGFSGSDDESVLLTPVSFTTLADMNSGVGHYVITPSGATAEHYDMSFVNGTLTIDPALLTITANNATRLYGATNPAFSANFDGLVAGDSEADITGLTLSTSASTNSDVGHYDITAAGAENANYNISFVPGNLQIEPVPLLITANNKSRTYGTVNPDFDASFSGLVADDSADDFDDLSFTTLADTHSNVGSYTLSPGGSANPNYIISYADGTLDITPAMLTISADDTQRFYGDTNPIFNASFTGLVADDGPEAISGLNLSSETFADTQIGDYPIIVTGGSNPNYNITRSNGTLSIEPRPLTITADDRSRVYGNGNVSLTRTYNGLADFDTENAILDLRISSNFDRFAPVGTYPITLSGGTNPNYAITLVDGTLNVTPKAATITANNVSRSYGDTNPAFTVAVDGEVIRDSLDLSGLSFTTAATPESAIGNYTITPSGALDPNYAITFIPGNLRIDKAAVSFSAQNVSREYGLENPTHGITTPALKLDDTTQDVLANIVLDTTATVASNVGTYAIELSADVINDNYDVTLNNGTLTIVEAPLFVAPTLVSRFYGDANPSSYELTAVGLRNGDTESVLFNTLVVNNTPHFADVGTATLQLLNADANNYRVSIGNGVMNILPRPITINADDAAREYGEANPSFTASIDNLPGFAQISDIPGITLTTPANIESAAGVYGITASSGTNPNYDIRYEQGLLTINKAPLSLDLGNAARIYGNGNALALSNVVILAANGLKGDDQLSDLRLTNIETTATQQSDIGAYPVTASVESSNYEVTQINSGVLTITPRHINALIDPDNRLDRQYGDAPLNALEHTLVGGLTAWDNVEDVIQIIDPSTINSPIGEYTLDAHSINTNYVLDSFANTNFFIQQRKIDVRFVDAQRLYGEEEPNLFGFLDLTDLLAPGDKPNDVFSMPTTATLVSSDVGSYPISVSSINSNYGINSVSGDLNILPRPLVVTLNPIERIFAQANPSGYHSQRVTGQDHDLLSFDTLDAVLNVNAPAPTADVGSYPLSATLLTDNYQLLGFNGTMDITPRQITLRVPDNIRRVYGEPNPTPGAFEVLTPDGLNTIGLASFHRVEDVISFNLPDEQTPAIALPLDLVVNKSSNYEIFTVGDFEFEITPRPITLELIEFSHKYGEENNQAAVADITPAGAATGLTDFDSIENVLTFEVPAANTPAGSYEVRTFVNPSYDISYANDTDYVVEKRPLSIGVSNQIRNYGSPVGRVNLSPQLSGPGYGLTTFESLGSVVSAVLPPRDAQTGRYDITYVQHNPNYNIYWNSSNAQQVEDRIKPYSQIIPVPLKVELPGHDRVYGEANVLDAVRIVEGSLPAIHTLEDVFEGSVPSIDAPPGEYTVARIRDSRNYNIQVLSGNESMVISPRVFGLNFNSFERLYGDDNPKLSRLVNQVFLNGTPDSLQGLASIDELDDIFEFTLPGPTDPAGVYPTVSFKDNTNYSLTIFSDGVNTGRFTVTATVKPRVVSVEFLNSFGTYGDSSFSGSVAVGGDGLAPSESAQSVFTTPQVASLDASSDAGYYLIDEVEADSRRYNIQTINPGVFTILPRQITLNISDLSQHFAKTYELQEFLAFEDLVVDASVGNLAAGEIMDDAFPIIRYQISDNDAVPQLPVIPTPENTFVPSIEDIRNDDSWLSRRVQIVDGITAPTGVEPIRTNPDTLDFDDAPVQRFVTVFDGFNTEKNYVLTDVNTGKANLTYPREIETEILIFSDDEIILTHPFTLDPDSLRDEELERALQAHRDRQNITVVSGPVTPPGLSTIFAGGNYDLGIDMVMGYLSSVLGSDVESFEEGSLLHEITRSTSGSIEDITPFRIRRWFERNADNPNLMPMLSASMAHYAKGFLEKDPDSYNTQERQFGNLLARHLTQSQSKLAAKAEERRAAWIERESKTRSLTDIFGKDIPWADFVSEASEDFIAEDIAAQIAVTAIGATAGGAAAGTTVAAFTGVIFPFAFKAAGATSAAAASGLSIIGGAGSAMSTAGGAAAAVAFPVAVAAVAIAGSIARGIQVFENEEQRQAFEAFQNRAQGSVQIDKFSLTDAEGKDNNLNQAIMMGALASMLYGE